MFGLADFFELVFDLAVPLHVEDQFLIDVARVFFCEALVLAEVKGNEGRVSLDEEGKVLDALEVNEVGPEVEALCPRVVLQESYQFPDRTVVQPVALQVHLA